MNAEEVFQQADETCPVCGAENAYSWDNCNDPKDADFDADFDTIYHIPCASGFEWECGKCGAHLVDAESAINSPCYTHAED